REMFRQQRAFQFEQLVQGRAFAHRDVIDLVQRRRLFDGSSKQVRLNRVLHVTEIAASFPITVDKYRLAADELGNPSRDHSGISAVRVLARPEDVEVSEPDRRNTIAAR